MSASLGSISTGTLLPEDLLTAFADALEHLIQTNGRTGNDNQSAVDLIWDARECAEVIENENDELEGSADDILDDLQNALDEYAPPYCYFGTLEGDGAAFGFWPCWESLKETYPECLLKVADTSEVPDDFSGDVLQINDHGNFTLYTAQAGKLTEVWSCV